MGFGGDKGLEYYRELRVVNLGAQVLVPELVERARAERADAVLVSQVVTQRDAHLHNTRAMSAAFREAHPAGEVPLLVVGGPRLVHASTPAPRAARAPRARGPRAPAARAWPAPAPRRPRLDHASTPTLGVDRVFGKGTTPGEVASYLVHAL